MELGIHPFRRFALLWVLDADQGYDYCRRIMVIDEESSEEEVARFVSSAFAEDEAESLQRLGELQAKIAHLEVENAQLRKDNEALRSQPFPLQRETGPAGNSPLPNQWSFQQPIRLGTPPGASRRRQLANSVCHRPRTTGKHIEESALCLRGLLADTIVYQYRMQSISIRNESSVSRSVVDIIDMTLGDDEDRNNVSHIFFHNTVNF